MRTGSCESTTRYAGRTTRTRDWKLACRSDNSHKPWKYPEVLVGEELDWVFSFYSFITALCLIIASISMDEREGGAFRHARKWTNGPNLLNIWPGSQGFTFVTPRGVGCG